MSRSPIKAVPDVGGRNPVAFINRDPPISITINLNHLMTAKTSKHTILIIVVFPEPLGPSKPKHSL